VEPASVEPVALVVPPMGSPHRPSVRQVPSQQLPSSKHHTPIAPGGMQASRQVKASSEGAGSPTAWSAAQNRHCPQSVASVVAVAVSVSVSVSVEVAPVTTPVAIGGGGVLPAGEAVSSPQDGIGLVNEPRAIKKIAARARVMGRNHRRQQPFRNRSGTIQEPYNLERKPVTVRARLGMTGGGEEDALCLRP
jgi:hypothetical protein